MKKLLLILLTLLLAVSLCACSENKDDQTEDASVSTTETTETTTTEMTTTETTTEETTTEQQKPITQEYQTYDNGALSFSYPKSWTLTEGSIVMMMDTVSGNNITVVSEPKNDYYATMDVESFNRDMKPALESMGMTVMTASVEHTDNENGVEITVISYTASYVGAEMKQTQYITNVGTLTYCVTITEMVDDTVLVQTVFDTLNMVSSDN